MVGTRLKKLRYTVVGTLEEPLHAQNLTTKIIQLQEELNPELIIAIDACLGKLDNIGNIILEEGPVKPGSAVQKDLPSIGNLSILGIVNIGGYCELQVLHSTRLHTVITLADEITHMIWRAIPLP